MVEMSQERLEWMFGKERIELEVNNPNLFYHILRTSLSENEINNNVDNLLAKMLKLIHLAWEVEQTSNINNWTTLNDLPEGYPTLSFERFELEINALKEYLSFQKALFRNFSYEIDISKHILQFDKTIKVLHDYIKTSINYTKINKQWITLEELPEKIHIPKEIAQNIETIINFCHNQQNVVG